MNIFEKFSFIKYTISSSLDSGYLSKDTMDIVDMDDFITDEPSAYINNFEIEFYGVDDKQDNEAFIGKIYANHIKINEIENNENVTIFEVFDSLDQATHDLYNAVYDKDTDYIKDDINIGENSDIFHIYDIVISPEHMDLDITEIILKRMPNILRYNRDIWVGAIFYGTDDVDIRRTLIESGYYLVADTNYLYTNPEELGYYKELIEEFDEYTENDTDF